MKNIYLDIDGVINAMSHNPPSMNTQWFGTWKQEKVMGYTILWSVELVERLNALAARPDVQIKWLTTWRKDAAQTFSEPVGLDGHDWFYFDTPDEDLYVAHDWWKFRHVRDEFEKGVADKYVWIDDDLMWEQHSRNWLEDKDPDIILPISPNSNHGITRKHMDQIEAFLLD